MYSRNVKSLLFEREPCHVRFNSNSLSQSQPLLHLPWLLLTAQGLLLHQGPSVLALANDILSTDMAAGLPLVLLCFTVYCKPERIFASSASPCWSCLFSCHTRRADRVVAVRGPLLRHQTPRVGPLEAAPAQQDHQDALLRNDDSAALPGGSAANTLGRGAAAAIPHPTSRAYPGLGAPPAQLESLSVRSIAAVGCGIPSRH